MKLHKNNYYYCIPRLKVKWKIYFKIIYKQILPIQRSYITWLIVKDKEKYQVVAEWQTYDLLTAAVTHFKGNIWDSVTVIIPEWKQATFAAIDAIIPKED